MDSSLFNRLSRVLATTPSRRTALAGLSGSLAALLAGLGPEAVAKPRAKRCPQGKKVCKGRCIPKRRCCTNGNCGGGGKVCRQGRCQCATDRKRCQGRCIAKTACCGGCRAGQACDRGTCVPTRCGLGAPCRVFVSSQTFNGDLRENGQGSGVAGADAKCQRLADASDLTQGGAYKAWISGSSLASSPSRRFTNIARTGPYVLVDDDSTVIASSFADLTDGTLRAPISVNDLGQPVPSTTAWTHTRVDGTPGGFLGLDCLEWTNGTIDPAGDSGSVGATDSAWTDAFSSVCDLRVHLLCFKQG